VCVAVCVAWLAATPRTCACAQHGMWQPWWPRACMLHAYMHAWAHVRNGRAPHARAGVGASRSRSAHPTAAKYYLLSSNNWKKIEIVGVYHCTSRSGRIRRVALLGPHHHVEESELAAREIEAGRVNPSKAATNLRTGVMGSYRLLYSLYKRNIVRLSGGCYSC
jgi:hypothetical protein